MYPVAMCPASSVLFRVYHLSHFERHAQRLVVVKCYPSLVTYKMLKHKALSLREKKWFKGTAGQVERLNVRSTGNEDINGTAKGVPVSGPLIQEQALEVAKELGKNDFTASDGWLALKFQKSSVCGEAEDVDSQTGYQPRDVFNGDETGLLFRAIPTRILAEGKEKCVRAIWWATLKNSWRLEKLLIRDPLKVLIEITFQYQWKSNKKSWMTATIMEEGLHEQECLATCHPHIKLSNVSLIFFPANTTSITQPMDQGVIYTLKCFYKKKVLQHLLTEIENSGSLTELTKKITVRDCVYWVARAAKQIRPDTVKKCFAKAGFKEIEETDDDEDNQPLNELADMLRRGCQDIDAEAVVSFNDDLSKEEGVDRAVQLINNHPGDEAVQEDDDENNDEEDESKQTVDDLKIKSYAKALYAVRDLEEFAASKNCPTVDATGLNEKAIIQKTVKQLTLMDIWQNTASSFDIRTTHGYI
ncbi:hypothetical protein PR048_020887, partial [Dryococelus australis]